MLNEAFDALKTYDWGADRNVLNPIDEAVVATHGDADARAELENRLIAVLADDVPRDAKDYVCRKLRVIGTDASVPALAALLPDPKHSHMARYALERIPTAKAGQAMRESLAQLNDDQKVGVIGSLGVRQEAASVPVLAKLVEGGSPAVAKASALALGAIRSGAAASALAGAKPASDEIRFAVTDASLACAEKLLADGHRADALAVYKRLVGGDHPKHIRLAATRGRLACAANTGS